MHLLSGFCRLYPVDVPMPPKPKSSSTLRSFLKQTEPEAKRAKVLLFKEVVGLNVSDSIAMDCLNASKDDIEMAVNLYFNKESSTLINIDGGSACPPQTQPRCIPVECIPIGSIACNGSLTTKLPASSNELYMDSPLNCSFSIKPPTGSFPNTPVELLDIMHGSGFIRFAHPSTKSEIGRVPAPLAAALCPLVKMGFVEVFISVGFPGCAGLNLSPGSSVPLRIEVAITPEAMKRSASSAFDDVVIERISNCWETVLRGMNIEVNVPKEVQESSNDSKPEETNSEDTDEGVMSEEMSRFVDVFSKPNLGHLFPPKNIFPTQLKSYQSQALYWMAHREYPPELGGLPRDIQDSVDLDSIPVEAENDEDSSPSIPSTWTQINVDETTTIYYREGFFQKEKPPPFVECRGGILADEMGLGRTVMTLSLLSLDLLNRKIFSPNNGGTLIVVHLSLLNQWVKELNKHCPGLSFIEFHGSDRTYDVRKLSSVHVVFTTYGTLAVDDKSPLMSIAWKRIVLDEAHTIRTRSTKMNKAVSKLNAERRWCLSGTPLQNSIEDIYPLVAWLRVSPWRSYAYFRKEVVLSTDGYSNARRMLQPLMLRRTKSTRGPNGEPLVQLPPRRNKLIYIDMSEEERDFYRALFWQTKLEFDKFEKSNAVMFNITHVLQLIIRLRQALCHPILCRTALLNHEALTEATSQGVSSLDDLLQKFLNRDNISKEYLENAIRDIQDVGIDNIECPICLSEPCQFPVMTPCGHTLCRKCAISRLR